MSEATQAELQRWPARRTPYRPLVLPDEERARHAAGLIQLVTPRFGAADAID